MHVRVRRHGPTRTYADFYIWFVVHITVLLLANALMMWQLVTLVRVDFA